MTLILTVNRLEGLEGKGERQLKIRFRDSVQNSAVVSGRDTVEVNQEFKWPLARNIEIADVLEFRVYNFSKFLANKLIGSLTISLQQLLQDSRLHLCEHLIDANHAATRAAIDFDVSYNSSDSPIGNWLQDDFYGVAMESHDMDELDTQLLLQESEALAAMGRSGQAETSLGANDDLASDDGNAMRRTLGVPVVLDPTLHKVEDFQLSITVIEAKQLSGANINPCIEVCIGDQTQRTEIQMSTNSPYYNQYFAFEFHMSKWELFDQVIHIRAINKGTMMISRLLPGDLLGEFRLDVRTVYNAPDHMFFHKWACLIDPKDILGGPKGYVKCDINVIGKGEQGKDGPKPPPKKSKPSDDEDIEANLLLPMGVSVKRQMVELAVKIYRAEELPKMNTDIMATLKHAFTGDAKPLIDPYVQVSFAGHTGKTKSKKSTYNPHWNEAVIFTEMFPPLCNRIRISVFDYDTVTSECIATHFIDLNLIMNAADNGFLPTFGPSWVNLYGTPRGYNYENAMRQKDELNLGLGEGVAYRGRLLLAIKTDLKTDTTSLVAGARVTGTQAVPENVAGVREDFLLVGIIYEAGAIDEDIGGKGKPVTFELSIGTYGYDAGGKSNEAMLEDDEDTGSTVKKTSPMWCNSQSPGKAPRLTRDEYYHVPFNERKPCLYMRCCYEDHRPRLFVSNILEKLCGILEMEVDEVQEMVNRERRGVLSRLQKTLQVFAESLDTAAANVRGCKGTGGRTMLDMQRQKQVRLQLEKMKIKVKGMRSQLTADSVPARLKECQALIRLLKDSLLDQQHSLPDVFVWMFCEGQRVAFARVPSRQILHSLSEAERGKDCGKVVTLFLRKPGRKGAGQAGWSLQCQLKMYLWLGLLKDMRNYRSTVPEGYLAATFKYKRPPNEIVYTEKSIFEFRAYLFMARNVIGSDESGLSDAFARVIVNDQIVTTHVISESLSPVWDRTLAVNPLVFYFSEQAVQDQPPVVVVEIFDDDDVAVKMPFDKPEFLGRCFCKPLVTLLSSAAQGNYRPPRLDWWEIYRGQLNAGELLAAFELIQLDSSSGRLPGCVPTMDDLRQLAAEQLSEQQDEEDETRKPEFVPVPPSIRPRLTRYRIEILFWGVRELAKVQFQNVESPKVTVEFGGKQLVSDVIQSCRVKPNFPSNVKYMDLMLPENKWFWPPLMFQCEDNRQFGRTVLVGNHVIASVTKYIMKEETEKSATSDSMSVVSSAKTGQPGKKKLFKFSSIAKSVMFSSASSSSGKSGYQNPAFESWWCF